jgi:hypothetical protein
LTGRVPFAASNSMALLLKHVTERPKPIADFRPDAPPAITEAIERALLKSPEDRWPSAGVMRDALSADARPQPSWRAERVEPVRYISPVPRGGRDKRPRESRPRDPKYVSPRGVDPVRVDAPPAAPMMQGDVVIEPAHLAGLTPEQRKDLRVWNGRVNLHDRIKTMRRYFWATVGASFGASLGFIAGANEEVLIPFMFTVIVPAVMWVKVAARRKSLHLSGLKLRRVAFMLRRKWVLPEQSASDKELGKVAPREVLEGPAGNAIRNAAEDRGAILGMIASLPKADRKMLPEVEPAVNALVERIGHLAQMLHRLNQETGSTTVDELDVTIARMEREGLSLEGERRLALLKRQRTSLIDIEDNRQTLLQQLENASLMLGNLRLDMMKIRSSGLQAGLSDISSATQEVRALSREIGLMLEAAEEARTLK